jgi:hypothetical protein
MSVLASSQDWCSGNAAFCLAWSRRAEQVLLDLFLLAQHFGHDLLGVDFFEQLAEQLHRLRRRVLQLDSQLAALEQLYVGHVQR